MFPKNITKAQSRDTGMAIVLILLLISYFTGDSLYFKIAIPVLILNMIWPAVYKPFAYLWLGFSHLLGTVMSKIILSIVYFLLVVPVGLSRRAVGKDSLQLKKWKKGTGSVFKNRDHKFSLKDLETPF